MSTLSCTTPRTNGYPPLRAPATDAEGADRRSHQRFTLAIPAYLQMPGDGSLLAVRTTNISKGGLVCLTSARLELGIVVRVSVQLTPHEALDCRAQVVRMDELGTSPRHSQNLVAFRFVDLREADEGQIAEALLALGDDTDPSTGPEPSASGEAASAR
jgi:hypothetical protein